MFFGDKLHVATFFFITAPRTSHVRASYFQSDSAPMMVIGFVGTGIGFLILGPSPILFIPEKFS